MALQTIHITQISKEASARLRRHAQKEYEPYNTDTLAFEHTGTLRYSPRHLDAIVYGEEAAFLRAMARRMMTVAGETFRYTLV